MTAASFADDMIAGGGRYAAVFHVAGMPWAVTTDKDLVAALSDPGAVSDAQKYARAYRRLLFGKRLVTVFGHYPSDHVQVIPSLDPDLGKQSISYDESKGLSGGGWGVKFGRDAHGAEYSHFREGAVSDTYDGLDVMPDPIYDSTVKTGILDVDWGGVVGTLTWNNDTGLLAKVVAATAAGNPYYTWFGSSCVALRDNTLGTNTAHAYPNCLRTPSEKVIVDTLDDSSMQITSAPSTSIVGMSATLWLVPMTADGDIAGLPTAGDLTDLDLYTKPVQFRAGPVKPSPRCDPEGWKIDCGFWQDFLNVNIPVDIFDGELRGYKFSRAPSPLDGTITRPHLEIREFDGLAYVVTEIWLCAEQESVTYSSTANLVIALNEALGTRAPNSDAEVNSFTASMGALEVGAPADISGYPTYVNGPLAWILALGYSEYDSIKSDALGSLTTPEWEVRFGDGTSTTGIHSWLYVYDSDNGLHENWSYKIPGGMKYYYQYNWNDEPVGTTHFVKLGWDMGTSDPLPLDDREINYWPVPYYANVAPRYRLAIKHEFDASLIDAEEYITLGSYDSRHFLDGKAESVGDNYIEISPDGSFEEAGVTMLRVKTNALSTLPMYWGQPIYYWPALHDDISGFTQGDQFRVRQAQTLSTDSLSDLFKGILGDPSGLALPRRSVVYHVTDAYDDGDDMREVIDWDRLDQLAPPSIPGVTYGLQLSAGHNIRDLFFNVLLSLGIRQTWGYNESKRAWVMSFEPFGLVNPVKALLAGRVFDPGNLQAAKPTGTYGNTWLCHHAHVKFNYRGGKPGIDLKIQNVTGRAMMASGNKTLKIDDKVMQLSDPTAADDHLTGIKGMLRRMNSAQPSVSGRGTAAGLPLAIVGSDCLFTSELIYDLFAGARGVTRRAALMTGVTTSINKGKLDLAYNMRLAPGAKGIGPSLLLANANMSRATATVTVTGLDTDCADNDFASTLNDPDGLTDLCLFGCIDYNPATNTRKPRACSCSSYAIRMIDADTTTWDNAGAGRNVWTGRLLGSVTDTLTIADVDNGACRITIDADHAEFDDTTDKVIFFAPYDDADLQGCQDVYGWLGDEVGDVTDSAAATSRGMTWS